MKLKEGTFPAGSLIVKRNQPYGRLAKILLEKQNFPDPNLRTYDDTGWTMGLMSHAEVQEIADKAVLDVPVQPVDTLTITGAVKGDGPVTGRAPQRLEFAGHPALPAEGRQVRSRRAALQSRATRSFPPARSWSQSSPRVKAKSKSSA